MKPHIKRIYPVFLILLFALFTSNCAKDSDLYFELAKYEEPVPEEENAEETEEDETAAEENYEEPEETTEETTSTIANHPVDGAYYVTVDGSSDNDGKSEFSSWSLSHAVSNAKAGDVVYVKAGSYDNLRLTFSNSGTADNPIRFMGYKSTPGDIDAAIQNLKSSETRGRRGTTVLANGEEFNYKSNPSPNEMPFINKPYVRDETALTVDGDFIEIENFIISGYSTAILVNDSSESSKIWNCIFHEQGNLDVGIRDTSHPDRYKGTGLFNRGATNLNVQFCSFLNVEQNALEFDGANSGTMSNNVVYSYNTINGTDYMFLITRKQSTYSSNLVFEFNLCERESGVSHGGHGFVIKNGGFSNTIRNFEVINTSVELNFANVYDNVIENGTVQGKYYEEGDPLSSLYFGNGAHHNTFRNIIVDGTWGAIACSSYADGASNDSSINTNYPGNDNVFINIVGKNSQYAFIMSEFGASGSSAALNNSFVNCTFYNVEYGIRANRPNDGNYFINSSFNTTRGFVVESNGFNLNNNTVFENCHFDGSVSLNTISKYNSINNIEGSPLFVSPESIVSNNFNVSGLELLPVSPLINAGIDPIKLTDKASKDFNGKTRTNYNIGAF
ncbi:hypothetical protein GCM10011414_10160 [Croceivirga lutea]|uniref:hypothetical protein n=1 Tax=Croceivirga lutea TaxID=1775167 RepID=UPI00163B2BA5|nr:hypothetical protein [Croceivirga lutea]GGG42552.1 hypothetical protein GCM10011414_10160 [Croceivirga lutea]